MSTNRGVIAAGHPKTAKAGAAVLAEGGNAVDAAIAAMAMSCLVEPVLSSPGGGGFAMVTNPDDSVELIDFFPQTPQTHFDGVDNEGIWDVKADFGTATQAFRIGPATSATPGFPAGIKELAKRSSIGLADLFAPTLEAARSGVAVTKFQGFLAEVVTPILTATRSAQVLYAPGEKLMAEGDVFFNPGLADGLEQLAKADLADTEVGRAIVANQRDRGHITIEDLMGYEVKVREPLQVRVGSSTAFLNPPPSAGGTLVAHSLDQLDGSVDPVSLALAFRATGYARQRLVEEQIRAKGTTHISVVDASGQACSVTVSNGEGNGETVGPFGFMLNNILGEEDVNPDGSRWPTNTRLSSMMSPAIVRTDAGDLIVAGTGGSNRIRTAMAQVLARIGLAGENIDDAINAPRLHVEGEHLDFEDQFGSDAAKALQSAFDDSLAWPEPSLFFGGVHAVARDRRGALSGVGDHRREGFALIASK